MYSEEQIREFVGLVDKGNKELRIYLDKTKLEFNELFSKLKQVEEKIDGIKEELEII